MTPTGAPARLAVLGSPIAHSLSPALHRAAYEVLGLDWSYDAVEVASGELAGFLGGLDSSWRGLSLTMPLKREVLPLLATRSPVVDRVGAANTVLHVAGMLRGFNTDVPGFVAAFREAGVESLARVEVLGAGATAGSAIAAVGALGATGALVRARDPSRADGLRDIAARSGVELAVRSWDEPVPSDDPPDVVISTLPGDADAEPGYPDGVRRSAVLFDVAYDPWPTPRARAWAASGGTVIDGRQLLLHQAIGQVRIFVTGAEDGVLERENQVLTAMRSAIGG
ncbi:MAG: shikimate dehydrogenase [Microbacteriaceae bacterium]|nr:shikimate dehydrogenase [Microbacteriaceae bacterium]